MESPLLSRPEAAQFLHISLRSLDGMLADGTLKPVRFGKTVRLHRDALDSLARGEQPKSKKQPN